LVIVGEKRSKLQSVISLRDSVMSEELTLLIVVGIVFMR
jgi:hypothetical protein